MMVARWHMISGRKSVLTAAHWIRGGKTLCGHPTSMKDLQVVLKVTCEACISSVQRTITLRRLIFGDDPTSAEVRVALDEFTAAGGLISKLPDEVALDRILVTPITHRALSVPDMGYLPGVEDLKTLRNIPRAY